MKVQCPDCKKEFEFSLNDFDKSEVFRLLTSDKDFVRKLAEVAAKAYVIKDLEENDSL